MAGVVAVISESLTTVNVAAVPPMVTAVAPVKPDPVMVMGVLTDTVPYVGEMAVTIGIVVVAVTE